MGWLREGNSTAERLQGPQANIQMQCSGTLWTGKIRC